MVIKPKILASLTILTISAFGSGYYLGQKFIAPGNAMEIILSQQNTWRSQFHTTSDTTKAGRSGAWVSVFKPRYTGAATYVVFRNTTNSKIYLLQTIQERVINGQLQVVCEPPSGFYNGAYKSKIPHPVAEDAESYIEKQFKLGEASSHSKVYQNSLQKYQQGKLSADEYLEDSNLWETSYREIKEETGLNIRALEVDPNFTITKALYDEIDIPEAYVSIRLLSIASTKLPGLEKLIGDEVISAEWIPLENFNLETQSVTTSTGTFKIKPEALPFTESVVTGLRQL